jgi:ADP-ribose pyrophosphatase
MATFEMIRHPGASLIVPFLDKNTVILLRQLRPVIDSYIYELPAGTLDKGETPLACARREIIEETGYCAKWFTPLGAIYPVPGYSTEKIFIYRAENLKKVIHNSRAPLRVPYQHKYQHHGEKDEWLEHKLFTRSQVRRLFKQGKIVDAKTICGLALCGWV